MESRARLPILPRLAVVALTQSCSHRVTGYGVEGEERAAQGEGEGERERKSESEIETGAEFDDTLTNCPSVTFFWKRCESCTVGCSAFESECVRVSECDSACVCCVRCVCLCAFFDPRCQAAIRAEQSQFLLAAALSRCCIAAAAAAAAAAPTKKPRGPTPPSARPPALAAFFFSPSSSLSLSLSLKHPRHPSYQLFV